MQLDALNYAASQDIMNHDKRIDIDPEALPGQQTPYSTHEAQPVNIENRLPQEDMNRIIIIAINFFQ
jgi:hypothetical protein